MHLKILYIILSSLVLTSSNYALPTVEKTMPLRKNIVTDENVIVAYSEQVYHLSLLRGAFSEAQFSELMDKIATIVPVKKKERTYSYFKNSKVKEYVIVVYGINKDQTEKIETFLKGEKNYAFTLSGEKRVYPYKDFLTPVIGYTIKHLNGNLTYLEGVNGLEKLYNSNDTHLNIEFKLQQELEKELFLKKVDIDADEVISVVIEPKTFNIKAFASSNRFYPKNIIKEDMNNLNINALHYIFETKKYLEPIQNAIKNEKKLTLKEGYQKFGFYEKSGIDLNNEKVSIDTLEINLLQLLKMYTVFYSDGKISTPSITKPDTPKSFKQIISKENALDTKNSLKKFFEDILHETVKLKDSNLNAYVSIDEIKYNSKNYLQISLGINPKNNFRSDKVIEVKTLNNFPYIIILSTKKSVSNIVHTYHLFSKKNKNLKIAEIMRPLNKYQANNTHGSEAEVEGFYKTKNGEYYIDTLTTKGTTIAQCNACQQYNVETFKVTDKGIISVALREYDINTHKPLIDIDKEIFYDTSAGLIWQDNLESATTKKQWLKDENFKLDHYMDTSGDTAACYCENLHLAGYNDWRIPTKLELERLYSLKEQLRNINPNYYWSSTNYKHYERAAWIVRFHDGHVGNDYKNIKHHIRCVRESKYD